MLFTSPLIVQRVGPRHWMLVAPLKYQGAVDHFTVPEAFVTDFASVPNWLQSFIQSTGIWTAAAVLHDAFCVQLAAGNCVVSSRDADGVFRRVLREEGVDPARRWLMWTAVRWAALFNRHRRPGWLKDAPLVLPITAVVLAATGVTVWALDAAAHWLIGRI